MWKKNIKYFFLHQTKGLEFRISTWKRSREIAKAYGTKKTFKFPAIRLKTAMLVTGVAVLIAVIYLGAPALADIGQALQKIRQTVREKSANRSAAMLETDSIGKQALLLKKPVLQPEIKPPAPSAPAVDGPAQIAASSIAKVSVGNAMVSKDMEYCILVNKGSRTLYLLSKGETAAWTVVKSFSILVGRNDGQKIMAGDERTPEGTYFIIGRKETEELNAIYGPLAYMLNYPNEDDRKAGRTGQGIWIHGTREDTTREATRGCVVLNNQNLIILAGYLQLGIGTPVIIVNMPAISSPEQVPDYGRLREMREHILTEYNSRQSEFADILALWKKAWESRDIDAYSQFYDPDHFQGEGMRWDAWREKKKKTFKAYNLISVSMEKICVSEFSESTAVVLFIQEYTSDVFHMQKPKKLSFMRNDGRWKIFKEETFSRQELLL